MTATPAASIVAIPAISRPPRAVGVGVFARRGLPVLLLLGQLLGSLSAEERGPSGEERAVDYLNEIKPLVQGRCYACHGANRQQASLRLDTGEFMRQGGDSGAAVVPGNPDESPLLQRVQSHDSDTRMPPSEEGEPLSSEQVELLRNWIRQGAISPADEQPEADWREHWAFQPRRRPALPASAAAHDHAIDVLLAAAREQHGLRATAEAPREVLIRRLYLDLIGLPPSPQDWDTLLADERPDWYERLVDRLLADPRHGERWGRHWMDVWRYSDWWGLGEQLRNSQKHIWHWRDWIIESINNDLPYDEMIRLMLAADETHPTDLQRLRATGFLARNYFLFNRHQWMDEAVEHVSKGFLGLTINCAKCHDHKFDPIAQDDYYRMRAIFEPYHVRLDVVPGATSTDADGLPRVYDGHLDLPTYRLIRGQETMPDKSRVMEPGLPTSLAPQPLDIRPVSLPAESWQPERRPWVLDDHRREAERLRDAARNKLSQARAALAAIPPAQPATDNVAATAEHSTADWSLRIAEHELLVADAELASVERRCSAMRAEWAVADRSRSTGENGGPSAESLALAAGQAARDAARAEREAAVARARLALTVQEQRLANHAATASGEQAAQARAEIEAEVTKARESLQASLKQLQEASDQYTRFAGAVWTATRFFDSTKDDPTVTFPATSTGRRTALANWIASPENRLTARVAANHIWNRHMGMPLIPTVFDLGRKGSAPTHPELLDWLASELVESGWDMKRLHRRIVLSSVYRLDSSSRGREQELAADPDNRWWWRRRASRIEAEVVRDSILSLAGELDGRPAGPSVPSDQQPDSRRRSLYFFHSNNERNLFLTTFDEALVKECYRRDQSIVPQQALALTNSRLVLDMAPRIVQNLQAANTMAASHAVASSDTATDDAFVQSAFLVLLGMKANEAEQEACRQALAAWRSQPDTDESGARAHLVWALLNHNDFVTQR